MIKTQTSNQYIMRHSFILAALKGENSFWRYLGGIIITLLAAMIIGAIPATVAFAYSDNPKAAFEMDFVNAGISPAWGLTLMLFPFVFGLVGVWFSVKYLHERPFYSLVNYESKINWKKVGVGAGLWLGLMIIFECISYFQNPANYEWTFNAAQFFPVLVVTLVLVPLQTSFEEFLFRGYLMQGIGSAFRFPIIALLITSIVFGAMHFMNPEIGEYGEWLIWSYVQIGIVLGLVTLMDEGLELALGVHAMNNIYAAIFVTFPSSALATPALITMKEFDAETMFIFSTIGEILFVVICAWLYKWNDWNKLFKKVILKKKEETENVVLGDEVLDDLGI
jgi:membrane protease YdiL (CAAX protease family)